MSRSILRDQRKEVLERNSGLEIERDFLLKSLQDLEEEHEAGDVSEDDYTRLRDRYTARAAEVLRAIGPNDGDSKESSRGVAGDTDGRSAVDADQGGADPEVHRADAKSGARKSAAKSKKSLLVGGIICLLAGVVVALVVSDTSPRLPGNTATGGVTLSPGQQEQRELAQAATLEEEGNYTGALQLYQQVLSQDPGNPGALSEAGWLEFEAGVIGGNQKSLEQGQANEQSAVTLDPGLASARAYLGSMYFVEGDMSAAVVQYSQFLADNPTTAEMSPFLPDIRKAFSKTKTPLPSIASISRQRRAGPERRRQVLSALSSDTARAKAGPKASTSSSEEDHPTDNRRDRSASAPIASSTGEGASDSDAHDEPE